MAELNEDSLRELFARSAMFEKPAKGKNGEEELPVPIACPPEVPRSYLARRGIGWNLPVLNGIIRAPTLRDDCSVLDLPGYDAATGLYLDFGEHDFPQIPSEPTREDAIEALRLLRGLLSEFAFADKKEAGSPSESVALSAFLTAIIRPALPTAPLHAVTATTIGSGKSYLVDLIATIATGGAVAPIAAGPDDTELEKRLASALMAGASFISVDNITREINGDLLNQMLTQEKVSPRRLGKSENVEIPCTAFTMANGNNLIVPADMARRTLLCSLDARVERPELRKFEQDPIRKVKADRGKFVAAGLTILRGFYRRWLAGTATAARLI
jgi:putative DNA primase/helicase